MSAPLQFGQQEFRQQKSRQQILDRIRANTRSVASAHLESDFAALPRAYVRVGSLSRQACLALMIERLGEYDAEVVECSPENLPSAIAAQLQDSGKRIFVTPIGLPASWLALGFDWRLDQNLSSAEIELVEGVVTAASCAIAESGTIVLHHSATEGRRVITLLPDWHLCILYASQVVQTLPEYFSRCQQPPPLATYISGPSATADIEMTRIKGVHGPRFLHVILVQDEDSNPDSQQTFPSEPARPVQ
jgi:L-lactate dehydrogenase complex protein LldG